MWRLFAKTNCKKTILSSVKLFKFSFELFRFSIRTDLFMKRELGFQLELSSRAKARFVTISFACLGFHKEKSWRILAKMGTRLAWSTMEHNNNNNSNNKRPLKVQNGGPEAKRLKNGNTPEQHSYKNGILLEKCSVCLWPIQSSNCYHHPQGSRNLQ